MTHHRPSPSPPPKSEFQPSGFQAFSPSLRISPTRDLPFLDSVLRHPSVYEPQRDDSTPPAHKLTLAPALATPGVLFLAVQALRAPSPRPPATPLPLGAKDGDGGWPVVVPSPRPPATPLPLGEGPGVRVLPTAKYGFFMLEPQLRGHIVHTCLLPACRGSLAIAAAKLAIAWAFTHTPTQALVSHCWQNRPHVLLFARLCGFQPRTRTLWPSTLNGRPLFSTGVCLTRSRWQSLQTTPTRPALHHRCPS